MNDSSSAITDRRFRTWAPLIFWIVATLVAVMLAYGAVVTRVSVMDIGMQAEDRSLRVEMQTQGRGLQAQIDLQERRLIRIEEKLDRLLEMQARRIR